MPDTREQFQLEGRGALAVGVADRHQTAFPGEVLTCTAVIGTVPVGGTVNAQIRLDNVVLGTVSFAPGGSNEAIVDLTDTIFGVGQTFDANVTSVGAAGTTGTDLDVTVQYISR